MWREIKSLGIVGSNSKLPSDLTDVEAINKHFLSIVSNNLTPDPNYKASFLSGSFSSQYFTYKPVDEQTISHVINKLKPNVAGIDEISGKMLQISFDWILRPLTHIINFSFEQGLVPKLWHLSVVTPIPKKSDPKSLNDLRPISLLCNTFKVAESIFLEQMKEHFNELAIIPNVQSGFRKNYSTSTLLSSLTDDILNGFDNGHITSLTLLDMSKAFDSLDIDLLSVKLAYYGVTGQSMVWMQNYCSL
ncbi:hypothetical protein Zmor_018645 [Zophobas morio]|uniref:Reverse transcriptase domain-containing protein n=1 Tax=Zophobas morio TaxID=2755281 RepID=A0AA38MDW0_9CUCU|nr:hypothetical protein Zmor_018645 [Zophobas morio]